MTYYKLEQDELLEFANKVYEEACYGYLDLKESVCYALVQKFIEGKQIVSPTDTTLTPFQQNVDYDGNVYIGSNTSTSGALIVSTWDSLSFTNEAPQVRIEQYVRPEQNFQGNESERI